MINLIKNELFKTFKRKNIYIMLGILFGFILLTNFLNTKMIDYSSSYTTHYSDISALEEKLANLDPEESNELIDYISLKTDIEVAKLAMQYQESWQQEIIYTNVSSIIYDINSSIYDTKNSALQKEAEAKLNDITSRLENNQWQSFVVEQRDNLEDEKIALEENIKNTTSTSVLDDLNRTLKYTIINLEVLNWRIDKNIDYSANYLNSALENYSNSKMQLIEYENKTDLSRSEKIEIQNLKSREALAKYTLENEQNINAFDTRGALLGIVNNYAWLIVIIIVMIAGGIVADEFSKGTIKLLLVKPFKRNRILASKYITVLLMIPIVILATIFMQLLVGGIFFGFDSLSIPGVIYNFNTNTVEVMALIKLIMINIVAYLPVIILISTLAFAISTIFNSGAVAIAVSVIGIFAATIINQLVMAYNIEIMKYFVSLNWDFSIYLFGKLPIFKYISFNFSIIICIIYLLILLIPTFIIFKKKNIKNI